MYTGIAKNQGNRNNSPYYILLTDVFIDYDTKHFEYLKYSSGSRIVIIKDALNDAVCIFLCCNALNGKSMNQFLLLPSRSKMLG